MSPGATLAESELFNLIFVPGFSTADKITDVSGRGVGMDVVKRNIEKLRGKVEIQSVAGQGATFSIHLPLTLAIIDGLIVGVGDQRYILPTLSVCETFRPSEGMISTVRGRGELITVRGRLRPVLRLYEHLGIKPASDRPTQSIAVVVEAGNDARCVLVDQVFGKQEVVIKSMGESFKQNRLLAGAAILGDGRVREKPIAVTTGARRSPRNTRSAVAWLKWVALTGDIETCAAASAGASFMPSPTIRTLTPRRFNSSMRAILSAGVTPARHS